MPNEAIEKMHVPLFRRFLNNKRWVAFVIIGSILFSWFNLLIALSTHSRSEVIVNVVTIFLFTPTVFVGIYFVRETLVKKYDAVFNKDNETVRQLFCKEEDYTAFISLSKKTSNSRVEYVLIGSFLVLSTLFTPTIQGLLFASKDPALPKNIFTINYVGQMYNFIFWGIIIVAILGSMMWSVLSYVRLISKLKGERCHLAITKSLSELEGTPAFTKNPKNKQVLEDIDVSFTKLREGIAPIQNLGYAISLAVALLGLLYAMPIIITSVLTFSLAIVNVSTYLYYGGVILVAIISISVFVITEIFMREFWINPKKEAIGIFEKLSEKVRFQYVKSVANLEEYPLREKQARDVSFLRAAILDLKQMESHEYSRGVMGRLLIALILSYIPLILEIIARSYH